MSCTIGTAVFNPLTPAMPACMVAEVTLSLEAWGSGPHGMKMRPGVQYSKDSVNWEDPLKPSTLDDFSPDGHKYYHPVSMPDAFTGATEYAFVRFGAWAYNVANAGAVLSVSVRMIASPTPSRAGSTTGGPAVSPSSGDTTDYTFTPLTAWVPSSMLESLGVIWEMDGMTGEVESVPGYQSSDDGVNLEDPVAMSATALTSSANKGNVLSDPTAWASVTSPSTDREWQAKRLVRFGVMVRNVSGTTIGGCQSTIRVEWMA